MISTQLLLLSCLFYVVYIDALSIGEIKHKVDARLWLSKYGYQSRYDPNVSEEELKDSIENMQRFANLPVTGKLDEPTLRQMAIPRCGQRDPIIKVKTKRGKRYVHQGSNWKRTFTRKGKMELTWTLKNTGRSLRYDTVLKVMREAFRYWQEKTNIDFIEIPQNLANNDRYNGEEIEILVSFVNGYHGDPYAFDGQGGTLAHAFYPHTNVGLSGDVHFDDAEYYTYKSPSGRNLLWVATHELGHSLGLEHSNVREAVMYPWYTKYKPGFQLHSDDILGLQTLYGARNKPMPGATTTRRPRTTTTTTTTTTTRRPRTTTPVKFTKRCPSNNDGITAIYYSKRYRQHIAFTKANKIYLLGYRSRIPVLDRYAYLPQSRIPDQVNAVFTTTVEGVESQVYFAGSYYYIYKDFSLRSGPFSIHDGNGPLKLKMPRWAKTVDAAIKFHRNGRTYFFYRDYYWRFDNTNQRFDNGYPKRISDGWRGLPRQVDAAFSSKDQTFFISGNNYYVYDDENFRVELTDHVNYFLKCKKSQASPPAKLSIGKIVEYDDDDEP